MERVLDPMNDVPEALTHSEAVAVIRQLRQAIVELRRAPCGHEALLREALEFIQDVQGRRIGHAPHRVYADGLYGCDRVDAIAARLRAASEACGRAKGVNDGAG